MPDETLEHHGILGQRWGVRRFQNYDGTRIGSKPPVINKTKIKEAANSAASTAKAAATKVKNYSDEKERRLEEKEQKEQARHEQEMKRAEAQAIRDLERTYLTNPKKAKKMEKEALKHPENMTDAELNARINRLEREKKLKDLTDDTLYPGRKAAAEILTKSGNTFAVTLGKELANGVNDRLFGKVDEKKDKKKKKDKKEQKSNEYSNDSVEKGKQIAKDRYGIDFEDDDE